MTKIEAQIPEEIYNDSSVCKYTIRDKDSKIVKQFIRKPTEQDIQTKIVDSKIICGKFFGEWTDNTEAAIEAELSTKRLNRQKTAEQKERLERAKELKRANEMLEIFQKMGLIVEKKA